MRRFALALLVLLLACAGIAGWFRHELWHPYKGYAGERILVDIPRGTPRREIAALLAKNGVVQYAGVFELYSRWRARQPLEAGEYMFDQPMSPREVFRMIATGRIFVHTLKVPEGWTMFDIAAALESEGICRREEFLAAARDASSIQDLAPGAKTLEGFLFPATYDLTRHMSAKEIAATMVQRFREVWASLPRVNQDTGGPFPGLPAGLNVEQVVTLASLVERETPKVDERPLVAGVFENRLRRGLALQCDPTVMYALALKGEPVKTLTHEDLSTNSPYNTYRHTGLPPGPIANPGEASLQAALAPPRVPYFFFVADANGGHFFSRTLTEHNRNVARYRQRLNHESDPEPVPVTKKTKAHS